MFNFIALAVEMVLGELAVQFWKKGIIFRIISCNTLLLFNMFQLFNDNYKISVLNV